MPRRPADGGRRPVRSRRRASAARIESAAGRVIPVVHLAAEYWPFAQTGGLAEAVRGLAEFQAASGVPTTVILPFHRTVRDADARIEPVGDWFMVPVGPREEPARLWGAHEQEGGPRVLFIEHAEYFDRPGIYGDADGDYSDNSRRFAFYCRAALQVVADLAGREPGVIHAHDWHTALAPVYLGTTLKDQNGLAAWGRVLSVHNAGFQGHFPFESLADVGLPESLYHWEGLEWYDRVNWLKGGLVFSDVVTTVSPTHAHELRTQAGGFGLHDTFIALKDRFVGVLNGFDTDVWDPSADIHITANYSPEDLDGKARCKAALQRQFNLPQRKRVPIVAMSARLVAQKGLDIILGGAALKTFDVQFVFLGTGEKRYEVALEEAEALDPERIGVETNFTGRLEHRVLAGADILLMPSLYEPCGLTQMRALRYGTLPVVRRVGGLMDTISDGDTGFVFDEYTSDALDSAILRALHHYADDQVWLKLMHNAMAQDFSWEVPAAKYAELYGWALSRAAAR